MNTQSITNLATVLIAAGFSENIGEAIMQNACFRSSDFTLTEHIRKQKDMLTCTLYFERKEDQYHCLYYEAAYLRMSDLPDLVMQGISVKELDHRMGQISWKAIAGSEKQIDEVIVQLNKLRITEDGKTLSDLLKLRHWQGIALPAAAGNLSALRSRFEVSQRFYLIDGDVIPIDEAHRFLVNRWMEKKIQAKKRRENAGEPDNVTETGGDKSLLLKKKRTRVYKLRR